MGRLSLIVSSLFGILALVTITLSMTVFSGRLAVASVIVSVVAIATGYGVVTLGSSM
jgi:hypothetical protein